jgi:hypothetical protein
MGGKKDLSSLREFFKRRYLKPQGKKKFLKAPKTPRNYSK